MARTQVTPRKRPKQARAQATVEVILEATARLLIESGTAPSTNRIAERAGVSIGSLYEYFPNKEAILAGLLQQVMEQQLAIFARTLEQVHDAPIERATRELIQAFIATKRLRPKLYYALHSAVPPAVRATIMRRCNQQIIGALVTLLSNRPEMAKDRDVEITSMLIVNSIHGVLDAVLLERSRVLEEDRFIDELAALVLGYLRV